MVPFLALVVMNVMILLLMLGFALSWNAMTMLRKGRALGKLAAVFKPSRAEWSQYYWGRIRRYFISYAVILVVLFFFLFLTNKGVSPLKQVLSFLMILPGMIGYFVLAAFVPARYSVHEQGFKVTALVPFLPGRRDAKTNYYSDFRVGAGLWRDYHEAMPRGNVLVLRGDYVGTELLLPAAEQQRLAGHIRALVNEVKEAKRKERKAKSQLKKDQHTPEERPSKET